MGSQTENGECIAKEIEEVAENINKMAGEARVESVTLDRARANEKAFKLLKESGCNIECCKDAVHVHHSAV
eukprot:2785135-Karenia_brevis.AAC.1